MIGREIYDFVVVGQGLAGTLLSYFLHKNGKSVLIIDDNFNGSSSMVAAGIVNPITGKNFIKSWRIHDFLPEARRTYDELHHYLGINTYTESNIIRSLYTVEDENNWLSKTGDPEVKEYMLPKADVTEFNNLVEKPMGYGELTGTFQVYVAQILSAFKAMWQKNGWYMDERFVFDRLDSSKGYYNYNGKIFREIIFCEGHQAADNPFFRDLGMAPSKGEVLLVRIPDATFRKMYKDHVFIVHQYDDVYWVGSGYEWNMSDDKPSPKMFRKLDQELKRILKVPYEIIDHKAAIRPTMFARRPVFKVHDTRKGMFLFNGLGTKGASIGPFAAKQFCRYLISKNPEDLILI